MYIIYIWNTETLFGIITPETYFIDLGLVQITTIFSSTSHRYNYYILAFCTFLPLIRQLHICINV
jgi:hypothetical protein